MVKHKKTQDSKDKNDAPLNEAQVANQKKHDEADK